MKPLINKEYGPDVKDATTIDELRKIGLLPEDAVIYDGKSGNELAPLDTVKDYPDIGYVNPWKEGGEARL